MDQPRISVVIPNFNHAHFLPRCLQAMVDQPVPALEVLVIDDASTDNSREVLRDWSARHPVIQSHPNPQNLGVCRTMNRGLELARGDYILFAAADDEVRPGLFQWAAEMYRQHPHAGVCSGVCEWRCTKTGQVWQSGHRMPNRAGYVSPDAMVALGRSGRLNIAGQNAVFRKAALQAVGGWLPELRWFTDWFSSFVVGFRHGMCHVPEVLSNFYLYPTSYYNADARAHAERRAVMHHLLELLASERYVDVAPRVAASGLLGGFGGSMASVVLSRRAHWRYFNAPFVRYAARRTAEVAGRKCFPDWLARFCLKVFYGGR